MKTMPFIACFAALTLCRAAQAQPDLTIHGKGDNPPNRAAAAAALMKKARLKQDAAQVERGEKRAEQRIEKLPKYLALFGVTDAKTQDAIAEHMRVTSKARDPLMTAQLQLRRLLALRTTSDAEMKKALDDHRAARKDYEAAFHKSLDDLDKKIGYTKSPRLEATLAAMGALDPEGSSYTQ